MIGTILATGLFITVSVTDANDCVPKKFGYDSIVCVCNSTYCDSTPHRVLEDGHFQWYISSKSGHRLNYVSGTFSTKGAQNGTVLLVNNSMTYQKIQGWGAAFTDSAGINIKKLSLGTQNALMRSYYGEEGSRYTLGRVPIGGCDFSVRPYTYDDYNNDIELKHFALADEDLNYKIPLIKKAQQINSNVKFLGAAWTAPPWMKTNNNYYGFGVLKDQYYQVYAEYYIKFFEAYERYGIKFWAISTGNEPINAFIPIIIGMSSTGWLPRTVGKWIVNNLGPTIANSKYNDTIILALDDQRFLLPLFIDHLFENFSEAKKYVKGIAVHWYWDENVSPSVLDDTHQHNPDKFLLMTESSLGAKFTDYPKVQLGSWDRGERLILDIIQNLNHWVTGWVDWNLALDEKGGPNWINNRVDASIIVNPKTDEFYQQPMYYVIKHLSRFVQPGSMKIQIDDGGSTRDISSTAFETPNQQIVVVIYNKCKSKQYVTIKDSKKVQVLINLELPPSSLHTIIYDK